MTFTKSKSFFSYTEIVEIEKILIEEIKKCNTPTFAYSYTKSWIYSNILGEDMDGTSKRINSMLTEKFPQFGHTVVVYPPLHGFSKHTTNFGLGVFRWNGMNIVVGVFNRRYKRCESPKMNLNKYLTYSRKVKSHRDIYGVTYYKETVKDQNDDNANKLYQYLYKKFNVRDARLLVFKGPTGSFLNPSNMPTYSVNSYPKNIWCDIVYCTFFGRASVIVYV